MNKLRVVLPEHVNGILAAVSGGADSVAMLLLLKEAAFECGIHLTAAHFEHGIRAEDSLADAAFVRELCSRLKIELIEGSADVPAIAKQRSVGIEEAARDVRYAFLRQAKAQVGADYIALAHHQDDQAETVLMHLLRGSGLKGVTGMKVLEGDLYRPLLAFPKQLLIDFLLEKGVSWCEDATNLIPDTPRNALRLLAMPQLENCYPAAKRAICRFAKIAEEENDCMEQMTLQFLQENLIRMPFGYLIHLSEGVLLHRAILMRSVHMLTNVEYDGAVRAVELCLCSKGADELSKKWRVERGALGLYLLDRESLLPTLNEQLPPESGSISLGVLGDLTVECGSGNPIMKNGLLQELDASALQGAAIRTRRSGDMIYPLGASGHQKLKEYFINRRIDRPLRDIIPLIAKGNEILWVIGEGISEKVKLTAGAQSLRLTLHGGILNEICEIRQKAADQHKYTKVEENKDGNAAQGSGTGTY